MSMKKRVESMAREIGRLTRRLNDTKALAESLTDRVRAMECPDHRWRKYQRRGFLGMYEYDPGMTDVKCSECGKVSTMKDMEFAEYEAREAKGRLAKLRADAATEGGE